MSRKAVYLLMIICALISCYDEEIDMGEMEAGKATLNLEAARAYFEQHATGLNTLSFERQGLSRSSALLEINTPLWSEAEVSTTPQSVVVEVPILSDSETWVYKSRMENGEQVGESCFVFKKLVVSQRENGHMNMFVVTFVPDVFTPVEAYSLEGSFIRYYGGTFSGLLFCSDLEGNLKQCFKYRDGVNLGTVRLAYKSELEEAGVEFGEGDEFLCFGRMMASRSYGDDETGGGNLGVCPHGGNPLTCEICNSLVIVPHYCPGGCGKDLDWENCACCFVCRVTPCVCIKCDVCGRATWDCVCATCSICNQKPCLDVCSECDERYCHGQCNETILPPGGGGGGGVVPPSGDEMTIEELKAMVFTPEFLANLQELGLTLDSINGIDFSDELPDRVNAVYNHEDNRIEISPAIFMRGYTDMDITSIIFHEFVHVKQAIIDKRVAEYDEKGVLVKTEYDFPYDDYKMQEYYNTFFTVISGYQPEGRPIPEDAELRTEKEDALWNYYFERHVQPALDAKAAGETYKVAVNYTYSLNEKEAYETEIQKYGSLWSEKYRKNAMSTYEMYKHNVEVLQNKN